MRASFARPAGLMALGLLVAVTPGRAQQQTPAYRNLQVLPAEISQEELGRIMLENLQGLGLPRRAGEGCLHCHVGSTDVHRDEWDYASDAKPAKETARVMMAMVREINGTHLARLDNPSEPPPTVTCRTCHLGRINPMPLADMLMAEHAQGGYRALEGAYRTARGRYYEAGAYDFRVATLIEVANRLAASGELEAATRAHELNLEYFDDDVAHGGLVQLRLLQALDSAGTDAMMRRFDELQREHPPAAIGPLSVGALGWRLFRSGRREPALRLFERSWSDHPDAFVATENLAYAVFDAGDEDRGLRIARDWIAAHPEHRGGRVLLEELSRRTRE